MQIIAAVVQIFATPKICPKSARNLPRIPVNNLPEADLYRQAQWKLIWADLCAALAGRFRADFGRFVGLQIGDPMFANRRPNVCKSATQIGEQTLFSDVRICRTVDLQCDLQILAAVVQIFATPQICPTSARNLPRRLVKHLTEANLN